MRKVFKYIENLWIGTDGKPSLRAVLAISFSVDFIRNLSHAIYKWEVGRTLEGLSLVLGIEAGLIVALLGLTTYSNMASQKIESLANNPQPSPINIGSVDTVTSTTTQAKVVNADKVETVNSQNTNIAQPNLD